MLEIHEYWRSGLHFGRSGTRHGMLFARESAIPLAHLRCRLVDPLHCRVLEDLPAPRITLDIVGLSRSGVDGRGVLELLYRQEATHDGHHQESG